MLSEKAGVSLEIYDGGNLLVRRVGGEAVLAKGENALVWDGRDEVDRIVPPEAYVYVLVAKGKKGKPVRFDLSDRTGGEPIPVEPLRWDAEAKQFSYRLREPSRIRLRIGLQEHGPHLRTVLDWVARTAGEHMQGWDGFDASRIRDFSKHPGLKFSAAAFSLPRNAVIVLPEKDRVEFVAGSSMKTAERSMRPSQAKRGRDYRDASTQPIEERQDIRLIVSVADDLRRTDAGIPILTAPTSLRVSVHEQDRARAINNRFEVGFFMDGQFLFENETAFFPMSWVFDPSSVNEGVHFITANLWAYDGNIGTASIEVYISSPGRDMPAAH